MTDQVTVLPDCMMMMPDGATPCEAFQHLQVERDRLRGRVTDILSSLQSSYSAGVREMHTESIIEQLQKALSHD